MITNSSSQILQPYCACSDWIVIVIIQVWLTPKSFNLIERLAWIKNFLLYRCGILLKSKFRLIAPLSLMPQLIVHRLFNQNISFEKVPNRFKRLWFVIALLYRRVYCFCPEFWYRLNVFCECISYSHLRELHSIVHRKGTVITEVLNSSHGGKKYFFILSGLSCCSFR